MTTTEVEDSEHVPSGSDYVSDRDFKDFPISSEVLQGILELGYSTATPVQAATIEPGVAGKDLLVRAKTGTGKTTAFCVPLVENIESGARTPQAIVMAPTRELAQQIAEECAAIAKYKDVSIAVLVGGMAMGPQEDALEAGAEIIIGTPGRIKDHIKRGNLKAKSIKISALDEADEMLSMGFLEDVSWILDSCAKEMQVLLFSATISPDTQRLVARYLKDPLEIELSTDTDHVEGIEHVIYETSPSFHKVRTLLYLLDLENPDSAIIFCNTREDAATVASFLDRQGLDAQLLSGELPQKRRSKVMAKVKAGEIRFLAATDVAARGIDISDLSHVINYSLPQDPAVYMHRVGRTGRIGKEGKAISLVGGADLSTRITLERQYKIDFNVIPLPSPEAAVQMRVERQAEQIRGAMSTMVFEAYLPTVRALKERPDGDVLLAAALRAFFQWDRKRRAEMSGLALLEDVREEQREERRSKSGGRDDRKGGRSRDRDDRRSDSASSSDSSKLDDLDALLETGSAPEPKPKKKRSRKKSSSEGGSSSKPEKKFDDLDALLQLD